jgi:hypothetical protein
MKRTLFGISLLLTAAALLWAQSYRIVPDGPARMEVRSVFPREVSPGVYDQVDQRTIDQLASQGWELVSVTPYVYRNEQHGQPLGDRQVVTQTYPAYFFKRFAAGRQ